MPVTHGVTGSSPVHTAQSAALKGTFCITGVLVQLVRIHACHAWGHGFESRTHRETALKSKDFKAVFSYSMFYVCWELSMDLSQKSLLINSTKLID